MYDTYICMIPISCATICAQAHYLTHTQRSGPLESAAAQLPKEQGRRSDPWITDTTLQLIANRWESMGQIAQLLAQKDAMLRNQVRTRRPHALQDSTLQPLLKALEQLHCHLKQQRGAMKHDMPQDKRQCAANLAAQMQAASGKGDTAALWV